MKKRPCLQDSAMAKPKVFTAAGDLVTCWGQKIVDWKCAKKFAMFVTLLCERRTCCDQHFPIKC